LLMGANATPARVFVSFSIENVDFELLSKSGKLLENVKDIIRRALAISTGSSIGLEHVDVSLSPNPLRAQVIIAVPPFLCAQSLQGKLRSAVLLPQALSARLHRLQGIKTVCSDRSCDMSVGDLAISLTNSIGDDLSPKPPSTASWGDFAVNIEGVAGRLGPSRSNDQGQRDLRTIERFRPQASDEENISQALPQQLLRKGSFRIRSDGSRVKPSKVHAKVARNDSGIGHSTYSDSVDSLMVLHGGVGDTSEEISDGARMSPENESEESRPVGRGHAVERVAINSALGPIPAAQRRAVYQPRSRPSNFLGERSSSGMNSKARVTAKNGVRQQTMMASSGVPEARLSDGASNRKLMHDAIPPGSDDELSFGESEATPAARRTRMTATVDVRRASQDASSCTSKVNQAPPEVQERARQSDIVRQEPCCDDSMRLAAAAAKARAAVMASTSNELLGASLRAPTAVPSANPRISEELYKNSSILPQDENLPEIPDDPVGSPSLGGPELSDITGKDIAANNTLTASPTSEVEKKQLTPEPNTRAAISLLPDVRRFDSEDEFSEYVEESEEEEILTEDEEVEDSVDAADLDALLPEGRVRASPTGVFESQIAQ